MTPEHDHWWGIATAVIMQDEDMTGGRSPRPNQSEVGCNWWGRAWSGASSWSSCNMIGGA
jgi:hypothetical protein